MNKSMIMSPLLKKKSRMLLFPKRFRKPLLLSQTFSNLTFTRKLLNLSKIREATLSLQ
jgi:hypothetical protein